MQEAVSPPVDAFEPFAAAGSSAGGTHRGAGLDLSIVRAIARAHGGDCTIEETDGRSFPVLTVPLRAPARSRVLADVLTQGD